MQNAIQGSAKQGLKLRYESVFSYRRIMQMNKFVYIKGLGQAMTSLEACCALKSL